MESILITLSFIIIIFIDATGDAYKFTKEKSKFKKWFGWFSEDLILLYALMLYPFLISYYEISVLQTFIYFISYVFMRVAIFNIIWNAFASVVWFYFGKEKWWDRILYCITYHSWFAMKFKPTPQAIVISISIISFCISLTLSGIWLLFPQ